MKFVASYSGGKDSVLALYKAVSQGMAPAALVTAYNTDKNRSWFHGVPALALRRVADALGIPVWIIETDGAAYSRNFEAALRKAAASGAEACVFGDIDIEGHRLWCTERCQNAGLNAVFPLWGQNRADAVNEFIELGFIADITIVNTAKLDVSFLGKRLTDGIVRLMAGQGADVCGENGEYHTFVSDGPIFSHAIGFEYGGQVMEGDYAILPIY